MPNSLDFRQLNIWLGAQIEIIKSRLLLRIHFFNVFRGNAEHVLIESVSISLQYLSSTTRLKFISMNS